MKGHLLAVLLAVLLTFTGTAAGVTIDAPSSVPSNVSWGFSVRLDPTEHWGRASVKIDGAQILDVYSNGTIVLDPYNGQFVLKHFLADENTSSTAGLVLYVSHIGLSKGGHAIAAASESGSDSREIISYVALGEGFAAETERSFEEVSRKFLSSEVDRNAVWRKVLGDANRITGLEERYRSQGLKISSLSEQVADAESLASKLYELQQKAQLEREEEKKANGAPVTAFANLLGKSAIPLAYLLAVVAIIAVFAVGARFVKQKIDEGSIYSQRDEHNLPLSAEQRKAIGEEKGRFMGLGEGRWKYKGKEKENEG